MKFNLNLSLLLLFITLSNCEKLVPKLFQSTKFYIYFNYWYDLIGQEVKCPNDGVIKNFVLRKSGGEYYFELQCYSSESEKVDYGEPIVKDATHISTLGISFFSSPKDIEILNALEMDCTPENGLNGFKIYQQRDNSNNFILKKDNYCKPTKSSFVSKKDIKTQEKIATSINLDCFVDILVGSNEKETETDIGFPLRSFQFKIEKVSDKRKCYYIYSYSKLKNMGKLKDEKLKKFEELRNNNNQVD